MQKVSAFARRHRWQVLVFFTEFLYMGLELLASRLMSPYFGTTLDVWTAILGVILLASAIGNHVGGRVADRDSCRAWLGASLLGLAAVFLALPALATLIGGTGMATHVTIRKTVLASLLMFALPGICIGSVTPMAVALYGRDNEGGMGRTSADVYVAMTLGGIVGTFVTGFVLVPALGSTSLSYAMGVMSLVLAVIVVTLAKAWGRVWPVAIVALVVSALGLRHDPLRAMGVVTDREPVTSDGTGGESPVDFWKDTRYGRVHVWDGQYYGEPARVLNIDGGFESMMFREPERINDLGFDYTNTICHAIERYGAAGGTDGMGLLFMGGGAYSMPRYMVTHTDARVDVMEIDDGVTDIARKWFNLGEVERQVGDRLQVITGDARIELTESDKRYDYIVNDTFAGNVPVRTLATVEAAQVAKEHLNDGGALIVNVIGRLESDKPSLLPWEVETLRQVFGHVYVFPVSEDYDPKASLNWMVLATDSDRFSSEGTVTPVNTTEAHPLTDDDSPVEWIASYEDKY